MKRIAILALCLVLAGCLITGCRRNDMQNTDPSTSTAGTDASAVPLPTTHADGDAEDRRPITGDEDPQPRGRIHGPAM